MTAPRCADCKFYDVVLEGSPSGLCRRHPPTIDHGKGMWPPVNNRDWCGEFSPKESAVKREPTPPPVVADPDWLDTITGDGS